MKRRRVVKMCKRITPDYVLDIRAGRYSVSNAVRKIFEECDIHSYPIDVFSIAERMNFDIIYGEFTQVGVDGVMWDGNDTVSVGKRKSKRCILLSHRDSVEKRAFTVAHEIGHFVLHCSEEENFFERHHGYMLGGQDKQTEDEADFFAANLLLPEEILIRYVHIARQSKKSREAIINSICFDFLVEPQMAERRLDELGLITLNTGETTHSNFSPAIMRNVSDHDMRTDTLTPQMTEVKTQANYDLAKELFGSDMRDFTKEEAEIYKASLKKIYKSTGVNIFDIC